MQRFYYKNKNNTGFLNLKSPITDENYIQITEEEFKELSTPKFPELTAEQKAAQEKARQIAELKGKLLATDYIVLKIAEAVAESNSEQVAQLRLTYANELNNRKVWRKQINNLEEIH